MSTRAPYPRAAIFCHPNISAAQAHQVARRNGRLLVQTRAGNFILSGPPRPLSTVRSSLSDVGEGEDGAGPYPEAA